MSDQHLGELLSAHLDGELTPEDRHRRSPPRGVRVVP